MRTDETVRRTGQGLGSEGRGDRLRKNGRLGSEVRGDGEPWGRRGRWERKEGRPRIEGPLPRLWVSAEVGTGGGFRGPRVDRRRGETVLSGTLLGPGVGFVDPEDFK